MSLQYVEWLRGGGVEGRRIEVEYRAREGMGDHTTVWCLVAWCGGGWGGVTRLTVKCCAVLCCTVKHLAVS